MGNVPFLSCREPRTDGLSPAWQPSYSVAELCAESLQGNTAGCTWLCPLYSGAAGCDKSPGTVAIFLEDGLYRMFSPCFSPASGISLQMTTWAEREFLCKERHTSWPGFSPRADHKLAVAKPPCTDTKIKVRQTLRCSWEDTSRWHIWGYHTWLDVGRLPPLFPSRPDIPYDSNVWRWVTAPRTYCLPQPPVPPPSEMDGNTYLKFIAQGALFLDPKHKARAVAQIHKELQECKRLKMRSEGRAPPLNSQGNILPPKDFNR